MILEYIYNNGKRELISLNNEIDANLDWKYLQTLNKLEFIKKFIPKYKSQQKMVLFDANHKQLLEFYNKNNLNEIQDIKNLQESTKLLFFTSGSSGFPVGAFKTKENLQNEVKSLQKLIKHKKIKRVVVTVPFVHIYGVLAGLLLPMALYEITLVIKEDFFPYELLEEVKTADTLVITSPIFIKALAKLTEDVNLQKTLFISSTAPLSIEDIALFEDKYSTNIVQLFGSTETGGIAYKLGRSKQWRPLESVTIDTEDDRLCVKSQFISDYLLKDKLEKVTQPYKTEDIIKLSDDGFELIGRSNKLIKIAGKRISAMQIEKILEEIPEIDKAIVELKYKQELLRSEQILITLVAKKPVEKKVIKKKINQYYGIISIPFSLKYVEQINYSAMGKRVIF